MRSVLCPCGTRFEASSPRATYCSARCRKRASTAGMRLAKPSRRDEAPAAPMPAVPDLGSVTAAAIAELSEANALGSPAGLAAVKLAQLIDQATPMVGASVAGWSREMRAALDAAKGTAEPAEVDPLDELERKRAGRRGA